MQRICVFKKYFFCYAVNYKLRISLYPLHERRIRSHSCMSHSIACFLVLEEMRELNKWDQFLVCGVIPLPRLDRQIWSVNKNI